MCKPMHALGVNSLYLTVFSSKKKLDHLSAIWFISASFSFSYNQHVVHGPGWTDHYQLTWLQVKEFPECVVYHILFQMLTDNKSQIYCSCWDEIKVQRKSSHTGRNENRTKVRSQPVIAGCQGKEKGERVDIKPKQKTICSKNCFLSVHYNSS